MQFIINHSSLNFATYSTGNYWYLEYSHDPRAQWYCPQVNMTWLHHWWVNIGLNNGLVSSGNKPLPWPMFGKTFISLSRSQRINIFTDSRWTDVFYLVVCMASNLIFRKQRYSSRRRSYIYPTRQCRIVISSSLIRGFCRQGYSFALATPGALLSEGGRCRLPGTPNTCLAALFCWSCRETVCYARAWLRCCVCHTRVTVTQNNARTVASWYK